MNTRKIIMAIAALAALATIFAGIVSADDGYAADTNAALADAYSIQDSEYSVLLTVGEDVTLTVDGVEYTETTAIPVTLGQELEVSGSYTGTAAVDPKDFALIFNGFRVFGYDFDQVVAYEVAGNGSISFAAIDYKDTEVTGEYSSKNIFDYTQIVTVKDSWTLLNGAYVEIYGQLIVPAGATLTVNSDAVLIVYGDVTIDGTLVVEVFSEENMGGYVQFGGVDDIYEQFFAGNAVVSGTVDVYGTVDVQGNLTLKSGAVMTIAETGALGCMASSNFVVTASAKLIVNGIIDATAISNYGLVIIDSEIPMSGSSVITMYSGAEVQVDRFVINGNKGSNGLVIKDSESNAITLAVSAAQVVPTGEDPNAYCAGIFTGLAISEKTVNGQDCMLFEGDLNVNYAYVSEGTEDEPEGLYAKANIILVGSNLLVDDTVVIGENVTVTNYGVLNVTGTIDARDGVFFNGGILLSGTIYVIDDGVIMDDAKISSELGINATRYVDGSIYYYVDIDNALAAATDKMTLYVLGTQTVKKSAVLPAGAKLDVNGVSKDVVLNIGGSDRDVVLTIAEGATINGACEIIDVQGTLFIENQLNVPASTKKVISADVEIYELDESGKIVRDGWLKYTNIYTAMAEAQPGDVVILKRGIVVDGEDLVIPADVTLDTNGYFVIVKSPWKIVDNGIFDIDAKSDVTVYTGGDIEVNGIAKSDKNFAIVDQDGNPFLMAGAYYSITDKKGTIWYVEPVANAVGDVLTYDDVYQNGEALGPGIYVRSNSGITIGNIDFVGADGQPAFMIVQTPMVSGVIDLDCAGMAVETGLGFTGTVSNADGAVAVSGTTSADGLFFGSAPAEMTEELLAAGNVSGTITVMGNVIAMDLVADDAVINGTLNVYPGTENVTAFNNVKVVGTLNVESDANLTVNNILLVNGTVSSEGDIWAMILLVGVDESGKSTISATPVVTGNFEIGDYALFNPNVAIPASISEAYDSTVFYGENDAKVVTAYAADPTTGVNSNIKITVVNAWFAGWMNALGVIVSDAAYGEYTAVYASIDYFVYHIQIVADYGVQNVAVDGIILPHDSINNNTYYVDLMAGSHTVTVTTAYGYTGTAKVYMIEGSSIVEQPSGKFTATGTPATAEGIFYDLQVAGVEAGSEEIIIDVEPADPTVIVEHESVNEWSVSTILMLVLVILIALMAVILFLRLNRS